MSNQVAMLYIPSANGLFLRSEGFSTRPTVANA